MTNRYYINHSFVVHSHQKSTKSLETGNKFESKCIYTRLFIKLLLFSVSVDVYDANTKESKDAITYRLQKTTRNKRKEKKEHRSRH